MFHLNLMETDNNDDDEKTNVYLNQFNGFGLSGRAVEWASEDKKSTASSETQREQSINALGKNKDQQNVI